MLNFNKYFSKSSCIYSNSTPHKISLPQLVIYASYCSTWSIQFLNVNLVYCLWNLPVHLRYYCSLECQETCYEILFTDLFYVSPNLYTSGLAWAQVQWWLLLEQRATLLVLGGLLRRRRREKLSAMRYEQGTSGKMSLKSMFAGACGVSSSANQPGHDGCCH